MEHVSTWLQAAILPRKWDVCGVLCDSVTVWHAFILGQVRNAYYCGGEPSKDAAAELLLYCSRGHADGARLYTAPHYRWRAMRRIHRALRRMPLDEVNAAIADYLGSCLRVPAHKEPESKGGGRSTIAAPMAFVLLDAFSHLGIEAAWDMPYAAARCMYDARRDVRGEDDTLETEDEERRWDAMVDARRATKGAA